MKTLRYLNCVLTVLAILLTLNVYVQLTGSPAGGSLSMTTPAHAAPAPLAEKPVRGVGSSPQAQLDELKQINETLSQLTGRLTDGTMRVKVDSMPKQGD